MPIRDFPLVRMSPSRHALHAIPRGSSCGILCSSSELALQSSPWTLNDGFDLSSGEPFKHGP